VPQLSLLEKRLLQALAGGDALACEQLVTPLQLGGPGEVMRAAGGPERHGLVRVTETKSTTFGLSQEGKRYQALGLPERRAIHAIHFANGSLPMGQLASAGELDGSDVKVAIGWLKRKGWANIEKGVLVAAGERPKESADEKFLAKFTGEQVPDSEIASVLVERGILLAKDSTSRLLCLTDAGRSALARLGDLEGVSEVNQITPELIAQWAEMDADAKAKIMLRAFDFDVPVGSRTPGKPHPLTQLMSQTRDIFWRMGFQEIAGDFVESAFWNMDALFIPQDHPAREMQDTFYLEQPATHEVNDADLARGKAVHEDGGDTGSTGWGGDFSEAVSRQALLRTHTTNTTIRYLHDNPKGNHKVFGLGRVFRKETMDATHLPEFHQIEGIVTEPTASFDMLMGMCRHFFTSMGFPEVRFRPAYFPYTEPSMEIDVMYRGKWMELGGCGVFRPEVTEPLGIQHPVLAWGFGLERLAMMRLGLKDIRQLYISDVQWLKEQPYLG
jgi:phenylalanyl-tRNA synthetase alpha chain